MSHMVSELGHIPRPDTIKTDQQMHQYIRDLKTQIKKDTHDIYYDVNNNNMLRPQYRYQYQPDQE